MRIFSSVHALMPPEIYDSLNKPLLQAGYRLYTKNVLGALGVPGLYDVDTVAYFFRDDDMAIAFISDTYLKDMWLLSELHALYNLQYKLNRNFILPIFLGEITNDDIPQVCLINDHIDMRTTATQIGLPQLVAKVKEFAKPKLKVFISHTTADEEIAEALANLIEKAYTMTSSDIICTSVSGHRLVLSANTGEVLLSKIFEAKVFICIATKNSIGTAESAGSFYVAVELGARWGMRRYLAVLLAAGATGTILKAPFNVLNALSCEDSSQVQQFIEQIGNQLESVPREASEYSREIDKLISASKKAGEKV